MVTQTISPIPSRARVLIVDDHPTTASTLARALSQLGSGIEIISATSGKAALEQVKGKGVDVVVTDMMMPDMNGLELIENLQTCLGEHSAFTVLITAYDVPGLKESARRLKVNETIIKPFQPERLYRVVGKALKILGQTKPLKPLTEARQPYKILVADDHNDNVTLLSHNLQMEGYTIITASNGLEVLEKTRRETPDLILLDINMPQKDGFEVLKEIREDPLVEHIPVIILTAVRIDTGSMQSGLNLGADDYMVQPFDWRELLARIRTKLRVKEAEDSLRRRYRELGVLPEIGKALSARLDFNELTDIVLHRSVETLGAVLGHIIILNLKEPFHKQYCISNPSLVGEQYPPVDDLLDQIKTTQQGMVLNDVRSDPRWQTIPDSPAGSVIIAPMFGRFDLIGLLVLIHEKAGYFNADHQLLLQAISSQAAIAVENAQLHSSIAQERQRLAAVLRSAADAILMLDADGRLVLLNPAGEKLFTRCETKLGLPFPRGRGYDALIDLFEEARTTRNSQTGEIVWPDQRVFSVLLTPIKDGGCVVLLHDVSHFKTLERVKNEFISTVSHDLKNPITTIELSSQLVVKSGPLNGKQKEYINRTLVSAKNMNELVQNLLEQAKMDLGISLKRETLDINTLVSKIVDDFRLQAEAKGQALLFEGAIGRAVVQGDPLQLRQAVSNLVGNAIKYTPTKGSITVSVMTKGNELTVGVKDTGSGIAPEDLPHIFDRFYQGRNKDISDTGSNGVGLAIVKSIVERHNGKVSVESELKKGSCFTITLPLA